MKNKTLILLSFVSLLSCSKQDDFILSSPNGELQVTISNKDNTSAFSVIFAMDTILKQSTFGLLVDETNYSENVSYLDLTKTEFDEIWTTVNGKQSTVRNHYNEYKLRVAKAKEENKFHEIIFRIYDKGFAYRYNFPPDAIGDSLKIEQELTQLNINGDFTYWAYNGENHNMGPIMRSGKNINKVRIPVVLQLANEKFMAIHEAEIVEFAPFSINASLNNQLLGFNTTYSSRKESFRTSWRVFMIGDKIGDLVESNLLVNLNEPCKIEDPSWIKPGKTMWDWRVWGYKAQDGFEYGLNTKSHKRLIDFASENNIQYLLIDADWYGSEFSKTSNPTTSREGIDIVDCMQYAKSKNIGVILYLNDIGAKKFGLERVLKQFSEWGAKGVKYGFMRGTVEEKVRQTRNVVELCAKYKLTVNFHDNPIAPSGDRRTYPNLITKEFGHSQADAKKSYFPETAVNQPLINMIAGPLDLCNGWFDLNNAHKEGRPRVFKEIPGTVVAEVAKLITIYTGCAVLPDSPEEYLNKDDLFDCIRNIPAQFDSFKVLDARLDEFVSVARKSGTDWFIGSLTNRDSRTIILDLSFLPKDKKYEATLYEDSEDSHFLHNKESYTIRKQQVNFTTKLSVKMGAGGGNVIYLKNISDPQ
ncbi:glycoside hydrolase family 97 catalytic domain-containing protein [Flavivirga amylovorans]|uniref:Glycoside hydrolase family 97 catalytic domain-containing protein n=1 Tax=Flavivirga amylovorans TaxID=870486 RepID=A0ABT8X3H5_9FLAO|nr:glycoside hydrolase family 97 protein [Flavivirga amylovorans]MDO5988446.1 glycoside hydrolase family 97 catalytic domain-containing protein [Flavivirga amylovorans]